MIKTNSDCMSQEMVQKYAYAIRHFRGYVDKEKFNDDMAYLLNFVREVAPACREGKRCECGKH